MNAVIGNPEILRSIVKNALDYDAQIQMCGIDLTVEKIEEFITEYNMIGSGIPILDFDNTERRFPKTKEHSFCISDLLLEIKEAYHLNPGTYLVRYNEEVDIPENVLGIVLPRSSLMRMGSTLQSAVWDPGYNGKGCGLLIVGSPIAIKKNAKIGQIIFLTTDSEKKYEGIFQNEGTDKK